MMRGKGGSPGSLELIVIVPLIIGLFTDGRNTRFVEDCPGIALFELTVSALSTIERVGHLSLSLWRDQVLRM